MTTIYPYIRILFMLCIPLLLSAQSSEFSLYYKLDNEQLFVRWMPTNIENFLSIVEGNMRMELYRVDGLPTEPEFTLFESKKISPLAYADWRSSLTASEWDSLAIVTVYANELDEPFLQQTFLSPEYGTEEDPLYLRKEVSNYVLGYEWDSIERSAMGLRRPLDQGVDMYALRLFPTASGDTLLLDINIAAWEPPSIPELEAKFNNKYVELKWRTLEYRNDFFGWYLDRSLDNGQSWEPVFELPLINDHDTIAGAGEALKYAYKTDYLPRNDVNVLYRLQGADYLGGRSENVRIISSEGKQDIFSSPMITETMQTDSNYAIIQWEFDPDNNDKLQEFRIIVTDTTGKAPEVVLEGIPPEQREASVFMKYRSNFYRVQAVSKLGTVLSSFESLVMMYDDKPPAIPRDFQGYVDTTGLVHLSWLTSNEPDLAGYYIFKSYFEQGELAMITPKPVPGPAYLDTVNMDIGNEWVYYQVRSVDTRGNSSSFTPLLALKKPDVHPPASARIIKTDNGNNRIRLEWTTSPSPDVESYTLLRKTEGTTQWSPVLRFNASEFIHTWTDTTVVTGQIYAYTIQVTDDDGLQSDFAQAVRVKLKDYGLNKPIEDFAGQANLEARTISLSWAYEETPREFYLYRAKGDLPPVLLKTLPGSLRNYTDMGLYRDVAYRYILRAYFPNGRVSPYTEMISITME